MEIERHLTAPCAAQVLFPHVDDLAAYPAWMRLVHRVEPSTTAPSSVPAWDVELRARLGPFARSKRLRMVRTAHEPFVRVVFERSELDGREHAPWVLRAELAERSAAARRADGSTLDEGAGPDPVTELTMNLRYGGRLWTGAALQRVLDDAVRQGSDELLAIVSGTPRR
jgi:hypothetical protein